MIEIRLSTDFPRVVKVGLPIQLTVQLTELDRFSRKLHGPGTGTALVGFLLLKLEQNGLTCLLAILESPSMSRGI
ncbi:hypothetical protein SAMN06265222_107267 [Neorhodopirellula lusitana]|uniref:Uncharacterized protein n=1 Tax=Neorhodopirellula lusitana TaxID=445327 RepID=A0ABY1QBX1_9BACT|nr:hypothetical protein SAMN06265222_107267 [Neorhodopirellula lusitana]